MDRRLSAPDDLAELLKNLDKLSFVRKCERTRCPVIRTSRQVGYYSVDGDVNFLPDDSELKYLRLPSDQDRVHFDLNVAYEAAVKWIDRTDNNMDNFLRWVLRNRNSFRENNNRFSRAPKLWNADFICYRGVLYHVMCSPYEFHTGWIICATKYAGNIYLFRFRTEEEERYETEMTEQQKRMTSWGYKFEQYMTSDSPNGDPEGPSVAVNELRSFSSVIRTTINNASVLTSAEMDGLTPEFFKEHERGAGSTAGYVELKTSRIVQDSRQERNLHRKMLKWWAQCFIAGVPTLYCGFRDDGGIVRRVQEFSTEDFPQIANGLWDPKVCMHFLSAFLDLVKQHVVKDDPRRQGRIWRNGGPVTEGPEVHNGESGPIFNNTGVLYKFEWYPGQKIRCQELRQDGPYRFIPDWYISQVEAFVNRPSRDSNKQSGRWS